MAKSNTSKGLAEKGSKRLMQEYVKDHPDFLNEYLDANSIRWISPIEADNYSEYRLGNNTMTKKLGIGKEDLSFWPDRGPQWDGIAILDENTSNERILLVEAKAHICEVYSACSATSAASIEKIRNSINTLFNSSDKDIWYKRYYQIVNRYVFEYYLTKAGKNVILAFVYFANDSYGQTSIEDWKNCINYDKKIINNGLKDKSLFDGNIKQIIIDVNAK